MTHGRPCMIGPKTAAGVPLPLAEDDLEQLESPPWSMDMAARTPRLIDFYIESLRLYDILHDVLFNFYSEKFHQEQSAEILFDLCFGDSQAPGQKQPGVFELERLVKWERNLPEHLRMYTDSHSIGPDPVLRRQSIILRQRYVCHNGRPKLT